MEHKKRLAHAALISKGMKLMKKRSIYEWAVYCNKNQLDLKTGKKNPRTFPKNPNDYFLCNKNYYQYFDLPEPKN